MTARTECLIFTIGDRIRTNGCPIFARFHRAKVGIERSETVLLATGHKPL